MSAVFLRGCPLIRPRFDQEDAVKTRRFGVGGLEAHHVCGRFDRTGAEGAHDAHFPAVGKHIEQLVRREDRHGEMPPYGQTPGLAEGQQRGLGALCASVTDACCQFARVPSQLIPLYKNGQATSTWQRIGFSRECSAR
ncbi:MAG TPA: hypothetical protein VF116_14260 [Ktedonobacterales bacterium]